MKRLIALAGAIIIALSFTSCDKVTDPFEGIAQGGGDLVGDTNSTSTGNVRKVLAEEFTGHTCQSCPRWSESLNDWSKNEYKGKMVIAALHYGSFAEPNPQKGYPADFRSETSQEVHDKVGATLYPSCTFSRLKAGAESPGTWAGELANLESSGFFTDASLQLDLRNIRSDAEDKNNLTIWGIAKKDLTGDHTVVVYIVEDSIISPQTDQRRELQGLDPRDPNYAHRHMVRGHIGSVNGNAFIDANGLTTGDTVQVRYDLAKEDRSTDWDVKHLIFVVAVIENATGQIIQADEIHAVDNH
ncbi:Omp28-related outer membrane protein [bacterium SCSIO 12741]|nr:Omp28-related outer membrane protein [bacterium SCSIO 12741]